MCRPWPVSGAPLSPTRSEGSARPCCKGTGSTRPRWPRRWSRPAASCCGRESGRPSAPLPTPPPSAPARPARRSLATSSSPPCSVGFLGAPFGEPGGVGRRLRPPAHAQLGEEVRDVVLDGLLRQEDRLGDLAVRVALVDE